MQRRHLYFIIGLLFVIIGFVSKMVYRPFAYSNSFKDFGIANSAPSFFYVIGFSFLLSIHPRFNVLYVALAVTVGSIIYECYQYFGAYQFDTSDAIYSTIGGILTILMHKKITSNNG